MKLVTLGTRALMYAFFEGNGTFLSEYDISVFSMLELTKEHKHG